MAWVWYYMILIVAFAASSLAPPFTHSHVSPDALKAITVSVTLLSALGQAIAKVNLKFYLFWQRIWIWWHSDATALWRFGLRLEGSLNFADLEAGLKSTEFSAWTPVVSSRQPTELRVKVDRTIHLIITFEPSSFSGDSQDRIFVRSEELEVPYGSARIKIDTSITPFLDALVTLLHPTAYSTMFDITYRNGNPFFAFYVAHLRRDQVTNFNLVFRPDAISRSGSEQVVVTQDTLSITSTSIIGFSEMARAFVLLSSATVAAVQV